MKRISKVIKPVWHKFLLTVIAALLGHYSLAQQPNVIVIIVDDAGYKDWGFQGSTVMETPRIDQLRNEGTFFSQAYVSNSVCAPSRAGLLTGRYQNRFGFEYNIVKYFASPDHTLEEVGLDPDERTIGDYMKDLGYATAAIGKWHLGEEDHHHPNNRGFDYFYGLLSGSRPYFHTDDLSRDKKIMRNSAVDDLASGYLTDVLTTDLNNWITEQVNDEKPFFTYMSYTAVHGPYESKTEDFDHFTGNCIGFDGNDCSEKRQNYAAMTYSLDYNVGNLVDNLKNLGVYDNTLIFFINDNGGKSPLEVCDNGDLRGGKSSQFEGGLRVPFFMVWPGHVPAGGTYDKQVISLDILPTAVKAGGGTINASNNLDGVDLLPLANDPSKVAHDYLYWRKMFYWGVVQSDNKKLIITYNGPEDFDNDTLLYNLSTDISETNNLFTTIDEDQLASDLLDSYKAWDAELKMPVWVTDYVMEKMCDGGTEPAQCEKLMVAFGKAEERLALWSAEAEEAVLIGASEVKSGCDNASGSAFVKMLTSASNGVEFTNVQVSETGTYEFNIYHFNKEALQLDVIVNGVSQGPVDIDKSQWCYEGAAGTTTVLIELNAGVNTIRCSPVQGVSSPLIDCFNLFKPYSTNIEGGRQNAIKPYSLYPNPCGDQLTIHGLNKELSAIVYSLNGKQVLRSKTSGVLDVSSLPAGIYFLNIAGVYSEKFIKK